MFGPFTDSRVAFRIGRVFGESSERVRQARRRDLERQRAGNRARREESDTDQLIDEFETAVREAVDDLDSTLRDSGVRMDIEFYPTNLPVSEETHFGADFGVRLHIEADDFNVTKGVLFQNKRAFGDVEDATFDGLRGDGERQAEDMLKMTPSSFFLLFNGLPVGTAGRWIKPPAVWLPLYDEDAPDPYPWSPWAGYPQLEMWNTGIMVLPASRVYAESRQQQRAGRTLPVGAEHWIRASLPFGLFMADLFGACFVGDVRSQIVRLVTPPEARDLTNTGVPDFDATMLPVRKLLNISVEER